MVKENQSQWEQSYLHLPEKFYRITEAEKQANPREILWNEELSKALNIDKTTETVDLLTGRKTSPHVKPFAQSYAGHQFGQFTMLGDGRAVMVGEWRAPDGKKYDIQLKGAGKTPYSRAGDGRASIGPMLREYIISEAMHGLGIPTTRSLALYETGNDVIRERRLDGAILTRLASSHLRVGTFEFAAAYGGVSDMKQLADYAINRHDPLLIHEENPYIIFAKQVMKRQATLLAQWQSVGFVHGVMNTDNMTISGETIDYGPCAFIDQYDRNALFSSIDLQGRYRFGNQPAIAQWNIARFTETLLPLLDEEETKAIAIAEEIVGQFPAYYMAYWLDGMRSKLGLFTSDPDDESLVNKLLEAMEKYAADYTQTFFALTMGEYTGSTFFHSEEFIQWQLRWTKRLEKEHKTDEEIFLKMKASNPIIIPRNRWVEDALNQAVDTFDYEPVSVLLDLLKDPYAYTDEQCLWAKKPIPREDFVTYCGT